MLQLRDDLGGVQYTPTVLVVLFQEGRKKIAQIEGADKIRAAIRSGAAEALISAFMEERMKLKMADRLAQRMALGLALSMAVAGAAGASAAASRKRSEDQLKEKFEREMEREVENTRQQRTSHLREDDDDDKVSQYSVHGLVTARHCSKYGRITVIHVRIYYSMQDSHEKALQKLMREFRNP